MRIFSIALFGVLVPAGFGHTFTYAQDSTAVLTDTTITYSIDEVVVTGTRTYKRIIDIPFSIQRVGQSQFRFDRKVSTYDVLGSVPGLFMESRYGNHDTRLSIRGFGSRSNSGIRGVRILLDGIPESEPDGQTRIEAIDFQSIGSIEIVKGNSSSLYTNAPGGVINFINDNTFPSSHLISFNQFGSFGLRQNGFKTGIRTHEYGFLTTYSYHQARGYRAHSEDYWHILNSVLEASPGDDSKLSVHGYFVDGLIRLPGSLTAEQFRIDPYQANQRDVDRDSKRISRKGRVGIRYQSFFGEANNHEVEVTTYGTFKYFERTSNVYRIINRTGLGASGRYVYHYPMFGRRHEFSVGGDVFYQGGPIEFYQNIGGMKSDILTGLTDETISNAGAYFQMTFNLLPEQMDLLLTGRYDKVVFDVRNQILAAQNSYRRFEDFTPKAALNYKLTPTIALYTSYGLSFDSPAGNELDNFPTSSDPNSLLNPDLEPQESKNFELGIKGNVIAFNAPVFERVGFEVTYFHSLIENEIVPFEVFGDVFFRNSARTRKQGVEVGVEATIIPGLTANVAYTYSNFTYDEYRAGVVQFDSVGNIVTSNQDFSGNIAPSTPMHYGSVSLSYNHDFSEQVGAFLKGTYRYATGMYVDDANSAKTEGYGLTGLTGGTDLTFGSFNILLSGGVQNIADKVYVAFVNTNSAREEFYEAGEPVNYFGSINLGYTF
ncbi:MAG: TonB-dependent receptor [Ignavibacteria bacterium]|nr:TonB-dependent receptor [Ignavibacteria bacterium]